MNELVELGPKKAGREVARFPGVGVQDIYADDTIAPPAVLTQESYTFLGDEDLDPSRYTSQEFFDLEFERVWKRTWQFACREEHIPDPGDNYVYKIGKISVIIVRTESDEIKAYYNVCRHRGTQFRPTQGIGHAAELRCPFHGWTWTLEGDLKTIPCAWDFPHVDAEKFRLPEIRVGLWGGFVFINMDPQAPSLEDFMHPLQDHFRNWDLSKRHIDLHVEKELECNWKAAIEAFVEFYHIPETHPQITPVQTDVNCQNDIYGHHVSRILSAVAVSSPLIENPLSAEDLLKKMVVCDPSVSRDSIPLEEGQSARSAMASYLRGVFGNAFGQDYSQTSDAEVLDSIQYFLFPNAFFWPSVSIPWLYRVRPDGMSPDRCILEVIHMQPNPENGEIPSPPDPIRLKEQDSFLTVEGMDRLSAETFDQDIDNLRSQREGYKFIDKGLTLSNYQEVRVRHLHDTIDRYIATDDTSTLCRVDL